MRVLFWAELYKPYIGGVEVLSGQLLPALMERGYTFTVICSVGRDSLPSEDTLDGVTIYRFPFNGALYRRDIAAIQSISRRVSEIKQSMRPDLVHLNACGASTFFHLRTAAAVPSPVLLTIHGATMILENANGAHTIMGSLLRSATWSTAVSEAMLAYGRSLAPEIASRSSLISNGLRLPGIDPTPLPWEPPRVLCIGNMIERKGFDVLVDAFSQVIRRFPETRLVLAGNGAERERLEGQIAGLGLTDYVETPGWVPPEQIGELINSASIVVVPSRLPEGFGLVALQAAQLARPVVATRTGGLPEVVDDGRTGLIVDVNDAAGLADALAFLLSLPETAARMGQEGKRRAQEKFGWEQCVDAYDNLYRELTARST